MANVTDISSAAKGSLFSTPGTPSHSYFTYLVLAVTSYALLVNFLRFRLVKWMHARYNYPTRESFAHMTDDDAWAIQKTMLEQEFPFFYLKSLQFALFRTYGIPSISKVLVDTAQFSKPDTSLKRYADTVVLIQEFVGNAPSSTRARTSIARTRWMHKGYRASGKILEDDMLYTLALFAVQPVRFLKKYEWRSATDLEQCAIGTFWKSIGDNLNISYDALPSGKKGFKDGLHWLEEVMAWSDEYEATCMVPHIKNRQTADQTTEVLLYMVPEAFKHVGLKFVSYMMDDRLRKAMMYDPPPAAYARFFSILLTVRQFAMRYLALPRPYLLRYKTFTDPDGHGRIFSTDWDAAPYYAKPSLRNRWGPVAWLTWAFGRPLPGDEGSKYYPQGYYIPDVGPKYFEGRGRKELDQITKELESSLNYKMLVGNFARESLQGLYSSYL
ncbi:uncharacterized protein BP01DRAFT_424193 [Aspergillus saccharolyticus JOP 1030-1]|uniref:ER-bound oxygenase mpaB/mpaB'/Rubber oxygenase catalytic domain-containing protein n=1 Tax=Aspergillus saccharolyticus JOP 1030-1 TaxID=1450539 RepID=A0A318ZAV0_9EURO|nr:hypothetical protein BP01DRAFT_424193 [Aspergillus saccharolyticus JOP 1030-1]PYH44419.1 hypothetical protein BP01DRAFT_424193 [Aspergillus saccharolyticus JOP 1030-1]